MDGALGLKSLWSIRSILLKSLLPSSMCLTMNSPPLFFLNTFLSELHDPIDTPSDASSCFRWAYSSFCSEVPDISFVERTQKKGCWCGCFGARAPRFLAQLAVASGGQHCRPPSGPQSRQTPVSSLVWVSPPPGRLQRRKAGWRHRTRRARKQCLRLKG